MKLQFCFHNKCKTFICYQIRVKLSKVSASIISNNCQQCLVLFYINCSEMNTHIVLIKRFPVAFHFSNKFPQKQFSLIYARSISKFSHVFFNKLWSLSCSNHFHVYKLTISPVAVWSERSSCSWLMAVVWTCHWDSRDHVGQHKHLLWHHHHAIHQGKMKCKHC